MDDINFDELDKAVSSALKRSDAPTTLQPVHAHTHSDSAQTMRDAEETSTQEVTVPSVEMSDTHGHQQATEGQTTHVQAQASGIVVPKRRGQFMDVVHPSSDMTTSSGRFPAKSLRQPTVLKPLSPVVVEAVPSPQPAVFLPEESEKDVAESVGSAEVTETPLEAVVPPVYDDFSTESIETESSDSSPDKTEADLPTTSVVVAEGQFGADSDTAAHETIDDEHDNDDMSEPATPFIQGTEVEKRPLGAFANNTFQVDERAIERTMEGVDVNQTSPTLPQELAPEVVSVESDMVDEQGGDPVTSQLASGVVGVATSIPQQYNLAKKTTDDTENHPVFDVKDYHSPLTPPLKRKNTGLIVALVLIFALLLGAAYAIFVLKLI